MSIAEKRRYSRDDIKELILGNGYSDWVPITTKYRGCDWTAAPKEMATRIIQHRRNGVDVKLSGPGLKADESIGLLAVPYIELINLGQSTDNLSR